MKKLLVVSAVAVLGLTSAAFAGGLPEEMPAAPVAASTSDTGIYLGLQAGYGLTNWKDAERALILASKYVDARAESVHKDNGLIGRVFAGYDMNRYFAVEGGYSYFFNKADLDYTVVAQGRHGGQHVINGNSGDIKTMAFDLMGKGKLPVCDSFDLYAKLGASYLMSRNDILGTMNHFNLAYGAGADYSITSDVIVSLDWLRLNGNAKIGSDKYQPNADLFMVGLRYKFDL